MNDETLSKQQKATRKRLFRPSRWLYVLMAVFILYSVTLIFPMLWLLYNSVKSKTEFFLQPWAFPNNPFKYMSNYLTVFKDFNVGMMFFNSVFLSLLCPLVSIFFHCCTAYAYARHNFKLKPLVYTLAIIPMVVSIAGTLPTQYKLINTLGIYDNIFLYLILSAAGTGYNFMLISSVFENMSNAYKEAALIDGAGNWRIFLTIYIPQAFNLILPLYILGVISTWNDYASPFLFLPSHPTLAVGIKRIGDLISSGSQQYGGDWPKLFATMILSILPILVLFIAFQKRIMKMTSFGGLKE